MNTKVTSFPGSCLLLEPAFQKVQFLLQKVKKEGHVGMKTAEVAELRRW